MDCISTEHINHQLFLECKKKNTSHAEIFALTIHSQKTNSASFVYKGKLWFKGYFLVSFKNKYVSYVLLGVA